MTEPTADERLGQLDRALHDAQRQERAEQETDLERQARAADGIIDALANRESDNPPAG